MLNPQSAKNALASLRTFARDIGLPEEDAIEMYREELHRLRQDAVVTRYVDVIAEKRTKDQLRIAMRGSSDH